MKELWTTNPFHLVNSPFAEIGYSSSEPNVVPAHLLLATRRPSARHPLASGAASADANRYPHPLVRTSRRHYGQRFAGIGAPYPLLTIRLLPAQHPSAPCMPSARQLTAMPAGSPQTTRQRTAQHLPPLHIVRRLPADNPQARAVLLVPPAQHPPTRTDTLNPRKNTLCTIVNCPLQIKPVFYFLFTSTAPPAHRIRVKSSLLRLGRFCLALPFTHLGKDIT